MSDVRGRCPMAMEQGEAFGEETLTYSSYLQIPKLLSCQDMVTVKHNDRRHDEHLFIIIHQAYELWFKQVLFEVDDARQQLKTQDGVKLQMIHMVNSRLHRVTLILKLMIEQFPVIETMAPLDFLEFRGYLKSGSGFQSLQFRLLEIKLGVEEEKRSTYDKKTYREVFHDPDSTALTHTLEEPSLMTLLNGWLEAMMKEMGEENVAEFWQNYMTGVERWHEDTYLKPVQGEADLEKREKAQQSFASQMDSFKKVFSQEQYDQSLERGEHRLSYRGFQGAVLISLFRDEPCLQQPCRLFSLLMDIDSLFTKWRYHHVLMVQRMIGSKAGTGGSSGYQYLRSTIADRYRVFGDLFNLSTFLVPRQFLLHPLPKDMKRRLYTLWAGADADVISALA